MDGNGHFFGAGLDGFALLVVPLSPVALPSRANSSMRSVPRCDRRRFSWAMSWKVLFARSVELAVPLALRVGVGDFSLRAGGGDFSLRAGGGDLASRLRPRFGLGPNGGGALTGGHVLGALVLPPCCIPVRLALASSACTLSISAIEVDGIL